SRRVWIDIRLKNPASRISKSFLRPVTMKTADFYVGWGKKRTAMGRREMGRGGSLEKHPKIHLMQKKAPDVHPGLMLDQSQSLLPGLHLAGSGRASEANLVPAHLNNDGNRHAGDVGAGGIRESVVGKTGVRAVAGKGVQ